MPSLDNPQLTITNDIDSDHHSLQGHKKRKLAEARKLYIKMIIGGMVMLAVAVFTIMAIYWGALWKVPDGKLSGWIVDFDEGTVGSGVTRGLIASERASTITWTVIPATSFPGGNSQLANAVLEQKTWVAISINKGSTSKLTAALTSPNASYDGSEAITVFAVEGRNEYAYRSLIAPSTQAILGAISEQIALNVTRQFAQSNITALLSTSPQTLVRPISFQLRNLAPFNIPVATAVTFVGLLYQTILSFFLVMIGMAAREVSGIEKLISLRSLIAIRLAIPFVTYFLLSLFYSLLSLAFQVNFDLKFGRAGFVVFWMVNYLGMLSCGLALESMITILTTRFIGFFLLTFIIANVSVCTLPLEVLPSVFKYGYGAPFYSMSHAIRTILFRTKNTVGIDIVILIAWTAISCITLPIFQWWVWRREARKIPVQTIDENGKKEML